MFLLVASIVILVTLDNCGPFPITTASAPIQVAFLFPELDTNWAIHVDIFVADQVEYWAVLALHSIA